MSRIHPILIFWSIVLLVGTQYLSSCDMSSKKRSSKSSKATSESAEATTPAPTLVPGAPASEPSSATEGASASGSDATGVSANTPSTKLATEDVSPNATNFHPLFNGSLGSIISRDSLKRMAADPTGFTIEEDSDGDGMRDTEEVISNPYVAEYPRIVTRIAPPVTIEIRVDETNVDKNHTETLEDTDFRQTLENSMEQKHYTEMNERTTPIPIKESQSTSEKRSEEFGHSSSQSTGESSSFGSENSRSRDKSHSRNFNLTILGNGGGVGGTDASGRGSSQGNTQGNSSEQSTAQSSNHAFSNEFSQSTMSETTIFEDIDFTDNLDRNGVEFTDDTVEDISRQFRTSAVFDGTQVIGPNAGVVRAALFIKNTSINMPVRVSNILCTLSFRTPLGKFLPVRTFTLRNDDFSVYQQDIMGNEEFGPYTIEINDLNTAEVKQALARGYTPQIHVVSYDMEPVQDSVYPGNIENLKILEESAKGRTATIKVVGPNMRELYRVAAFDVDDQGNYSPGISLKKALFNIFRDRLSGGEQWGSEPLTVPDADLRWKTGDEEHPFNTSLDGNSWSQFETYLKEHTDDAGQVSYIETIRRIGTLEKYNPFNVEDNPTYNPNELMSIDQLSRMKYWIILHNGRYFEGDLNDAIWVGERYEIIFFDASDFNDHFDSVVYDPLQSGEAFSLNTRWNRLTNEGEFARSINLGKVVARDVVHLELDLLETRQLFDPSVVGSGFGPLNYFPDEDGAGWYNFNYTLQEEDILPNGIPQNFSFTAAGGINHIVVSLDQFSENAHEYIVSFCLLSGQDCAATPKEVSIAPDEFDGEDNSFTITRKTLDINSSAIGLIEVGNYRVNIEARGVFNNVAVSTPSNNQDVDIIVNGPPAPPPNFTYTLVKLREAIGINIPNALNTEYFLVQVFGPFNYGFQPGDAPMIFYANQGDNTFNIPRPSQALNEDEDGVYEVKVFAVNDQTIVNDVEDLTLSVQGRGQLNFIGVEFERFESQKVFAPRLTETISKMGAIDLEVNFNDGTGWYRLALSSEDTVSGENTLNVQDSSYLQLDQQKFHIFFKVPDGSSGAYNAFAGGREEVDVFLRTNPQSQYRDTFWLKPNIVNGEITPYNAIGDASHTIYLRQALNTLPSRSIIEHWISRHRTDASRVEESLACYGYSNTPIDFSGNSWFDVDQCDGENMAIVSQNAPLSLDDYFFSPLTEHTYGIRANFAPALAPSSSATPEQPFFQVRNQQETIVVDQLSAARATSFKIYYTESSIDALGANYNLQDWEVSPETTAGEGAFYVINQLLSTGAPLAPEAYYTVVVEAINAGSSSISAPREIFFSPFLSDTPLVPQGATLSRSPDGTTITIDNIYAPGEVQYEVRWWKSQDRPDEPLETWQSQTAAGGSIVLNGLDANKEYIVELASTRPDGSRSEAAKLLTADFVSQWEIGQAMNPIDPDFSSAVVALDKDGNSYALADLNAGGSISWKGILVGAQQSGLGLKPSFVFKQNPDGEVLWAKTIYETRSHFSTIQLSLVLSDQGGFYIAGHFLTEIYFPLPGGGSFSLNFANDDHRNFFIAKYDSNADFLWAKSLGYGYDAASPTPQNAEYLTQIVLDNDDNIYGIGSFNGNFEIDGVLQATAANPDLFLVKYDPLGNLLWIKFFVGSDSDSARNLLFDKNINMLYVAGSTLGSLDLDGISIPSIHPSQLFLAQFDLDGNAIWAKAVSDTQGTLAPTVLAGADGDIYVLGQVISTVANFDDNTQINTPGALIAQYNRFGEFQWVRALVAPSSVDLWSFRHAVSDSRGNVILTAQLQFSSGVIEWNEGFAAQPAAAQEAFRFAFDKDGNGLFFDKNQLDYIVNTSGNSAQSILGNNGELYVIHPKVFSDIGSHAVINKTQVRLP